MTYSNIPEVLRHRIPTIPDFPKPGILFRNVLPVLRDPSMLRGIVGTMCRPLWTDPVTKILGIESRGFIIGSMMAMHLGIGFEPARKPGKLPGSTDRVDYDLEYGSASLEIASEAFTTLDRVLIVDDLLATGGTAAAAAQLVAKQGADVAGFSFVIELSALKGCERLIQDWGGTGAPMGREVVRSLVTFDD